MNFSTPSAPSLCSLPGFGSGQIWLLFQPCFSHHLSHAYPLQPECLLNRAAKHEKGTFADSPLPQKEIQLFLLQRQRLIFPASSSLIPPSCSAPATLTFQFLEYILFCFLAPSIFPLCLNNYYSSHKPCLNMASSNKSFMAKVRNFSYVLPRQFTNYTIW